MFLHVIKIKDSCASSFRNKEWINSKPGLQEN